MDTLLIGDRARKYRFPRQKAHLLAAALRSLDGLDTAAQDRALRDDLMQLPGIGPKTASWIVRNFRGSDAVAILDVHIVRAGQLAGIFPRSLTPDRHYDRLEQLFLAFARDLGVRASVLDALMWDYMRRIPSTLTLASLDANSGDANGPQVWANGESALNLTS